MKGRDPMRLTDGFDRNVAEKMPKVRKEGAPSLSFSNVQLEREFERRDLPEPLTPEPEKKQGRVPPGDEQQEGGEKEQNLNVLTLIEDLHSQLLLSSQTKRALEMDLASSQKTLQQFIQDNQELRQESEDLRREVQKLRELQSEAAYLREENADAQEKIHQLLQEVRSLKEGLARMSREREEALHSARDLGSHVEQMEILRIKGKLREKEAVHFANENRALQARLEEVLAQNRELEKKYDEMRKSFNEVRDSLTVLRDSCKRNYYSLTEPSD